MCRRCEEGMEPMEEYWYGCDDDNREFWRRATWFLFWLGVIILLVTLCAV